jgi:hypothetical protein
LDESLGLGIKVRRSFIEYENSGVRKERARDSNSLTLPTGKFHSPFTHNSVVTIRQLRDEFVNVADATRLGYFCVSCARSAERDVLTDGPVEQECFLEHDS